MYSGVLSNDGKIIMKGLYLYCFDTFTGDKLWTSDWYVDGELVLYADNSLFVCLGYTVDNGGGCFAVQQ